MTIYPKPHNALYCTSDETKPLLVIPLPLGSFLPSSSSSFLHFKHLHHDHDHLQRAPSLAQFHFVDPTSVFSNEGISSLVVTQLPRLN